MRFLQMALLTLAFCGVAAAAHAGTCTTGPANSVVPPKTDSDGWAMVNNCGGGGSSTPATPPGTAGSTGITATTVPASGTPSPCTASTIGTSPTLILDSVANGVGRTGGQIIIPTTATATITYQWASSPTLTTTAGGTVFPISAGGYIPFAGAPNVPLYMVASSSVATSCQSVK